MPRQPVLPYPLSWHVHTCPVRPAFSSRNAVRPLHGCSDWDAYLRCCAIYSGHHEAEVSPLSFGSWAIACYLQMYAVSD